MSQPIALNPAQQESLVKDIGFALIQAAPEDWTQLRAEYRAAGRYFELAAEVTGPDGQPRSWTAPQDVAPLFVRLRAGMHREDRGTWLNAKYQLDRPASYKLDYDREEPLWQSPPPPQAYLDELRFFPRSEANIPAWLMAKVAAMNHIGPGNSTFHFRTARIFDGPGPNGRPMVNRPQLDPSEISAMLSYLDNAPLALTSTNIDTDRLAADNPESIPVAFHTDGVWIWPAAVSFYLARYHISPDMELVAHIRAKNFQLPAVDEQARVAAAAHLSGMVPGAQLAPPPAPRPAVLPSDETTMIAVPAQQPDTDAQTSFVPPVSVDHEIRADEMPLVAPDIGYELADPPIARQEPDYIIATLQQLLDDLGVPAQLYSIGEPAPNTWYLEQVHDGWQVGWYEHGFSTPMLFDEQHDAAAFLLGKLLLPKKNPQAEEVSEEALMTSVDDIVQAPLETTPEDTASEHADATATVMTAVEVPSLPRYSNPDVPVDKTDHLLPAATEVPSIPGIAVPQPATHRKSEQSRLEQWPIQPLRGEPPLTLFRGKRLTELPTGTEVDRFGQPDGNLTYAGGTPFARRSLVPEWINRPYHVYRLQRPAQALTGVAVPWFGQPGGGTAYVLPRSIEDLIADGTLVEVDYDRAPTG